MKHHFVFLIVTIFLFVSCLQDKSLINTDQTPERPSNPFPKNAADNIDLETTLSWNSENAVSYDVLFDTISPPLNYYIKNHTANSLMIQDLNYNTEYFWRITAHFENGDSLRGDVWNFRTKSFSIDSLKSLLIEIPRLTVGVERTWARYENGNLYASGVDTTTRSLVYHELLNGEYSYGILEEDTLTLVADTLVFKREITLNCKIVLHPEQENLDLIYSLSQHAENSDPILFLQQDLSFSLIEVPFQINDNDLITIISSDGFVQHLAYSSYHRTAEDVLSHIGPLVEKSTEVYLGFIQLFFQSEIRIKITQ